MTTTAREDQYLAAPEPVRQPYDTVAILRRNIADMEVALKQQTHRAEAAEAELARMAQQKPIKYLYRVTDCFGHDVLRDDPKGATILETIPLYAAHVPASHKGATHCDDCGLTWLDDGLNPLRCPYCKVPVPVPAVPYGVDDEAANRISLAVYDWKKGINPEPLLYAINRILATEAHPLSAEGQRAMLQSSPKAPAVPEEWRKVMAELTADLQAACDAEHPHRDQYPSVMRKYNNDMEIVETARALLQSHPQSIAAPAEWRAVMAELLANDGADGGRYDANKWLAARDKARALLQSAEPNNNAAADRLLEGGE